MFTGLDIFAIIDKGRAAHLSLPAAATLRHLGGHWLRIVHRCLAPDPAQRYASAAEVRAALEAKPRRFGWKSLTAASLFLGATLVAAFSVLYTPGNDVAILPFANATGDPALDYAAEGLAQSLQQNLIRTPQLRVAPWSALPKWRGLPSDTLAAGKELRTTVLIGGVLKRHDSRFFLDVEVVAASRGRRLWSRQYVRPVSGLLQLEESLLQDVRPSVFDHAAPEASSIRSPDPAAYDLYLRGLSTLQRRTPDSIADAAELFRAAVAKDPAYARAHAALANALFQFGSHVLQPAPETLPGATAEAHRALELDPNLPEAHLALAQTLAANFEWAEAEAEFHRAIRLNPQYADAHGALARMVLIPMKRTEEAILESRRAVDLDPQDPIQRWNLAYNLYEARQFRLLLTLMDRYSYAALAHDNIVRLSTGTLKGATLAALGRPDEALIATGFPVEAASDAAPPMIYYVNQGIRGYVLARLGRRQEAEAIAREMTSYHGTGIYPCHSAAIYGALGHRDQSFRLLETCYAIRGPAFPNLGVDPRYDPLRSDPRFKAILAKAHLP